MIRMIGVLFAILSTPSLADYYVVGKVTGTECNGFVIKICGQKSIDAVEKDGNLYEITQRFKNVDKFSKGRCTINTKNSNGGVISGITNLVKQPNFLTLKNGKYESVDADYISFKCAKK